MEPEIRKQKYIDKLKKTCFKEQKKNIGYSDIHNNNSASFNESHLQFSELKFEPNDLLAKVERYIKANPTSHITKNRLSVRRSLYQHRSESNIYSRKTANKFCAVQNVENVISFIQSKEKVMYKPDSNIKVGPPNATSTINYQQPQYVSIFQKINCKSTRDRENNEHDKNEKMHLNESLYNSSSSSEFINSKNDESKLQGLSCTLLNQKQNKNKHFSIEDKAKLNLTHYLYLEFVHLHCDELKRISENVYPNNDYRIDLKRQLQQITLKHENKSNADYIHLTSSPGLVIYNKSMNIVDYLSLGSTISCSDFNFEPVNNSSNVTDTLRTFQLSLDSFVCSSTQETSFTNNDDSMDIDNVKLNQTKEYFSSPDIGWNEYNNNQYRQKVTRLFNSNKSRSITYLSSFDLNSEELIQKSNNNQDSIFNLYSDLSLSSEDSFKLY